jgi:penicillin-binding protein 2
MGRRKRIVYDPPHARKNGKGRRASVLRPEQLFMTRRMLLAKGAVVATFGGLAARLGIMQLAEGEEYRTLAARNTTQAEPIPATRGLIYDRSGRELAVNQQTWEVRLKPGELPDDPAERDRILGHLTNALKLPDALVLDPNDVPEEAQSIVYARTAQLLGKTLTVEPTERTAQYPFFRVAGQMTLVNGHDLLLFVYPDETSRKSDSARITANGRLVAGQEVAWPAPPRFASGGNVLAILLGADDRLGSRVERAVEKLGPATSTEQVVTALREDALEAWTAYIESERERNFLVRLEDDLTTDQAALCRAHLNELPGVGVMNQLQYLVRNGRLQEQIAVKTGVPREVALKLEANRLNLPGVELDSGVLVRRYPGGEAMSHILGYVGKISEEELLRAGELDDQRRAVDENGRIVYEPNDYIGKDGIELQLESMLRGRAGRQIVEMDPAGASWRTLPDSVVDPVPGADVRLSVDLEFQRAVAEILGEGIRYSNEDRQALAAVDPTRRVTKLSGAGSVVALDPRTGEILAMVSYPLYDNQLFVDGISQRKYQEYTSEEADKPLLDRCTRGEYPPGSTLKPFVAAAGLQDKKIDLTKTYTCTGAIQVPYAWDQSKGNTHPCWIWRIGGHEALDVYGALEQSCDVFFYNVGAPRQPIDESKTEYLHYRDSYLNDKRLGLDKHYFEGLGIQPMKRFLAEQFWFDQPTGIELPAEARGVVPDAEWRARQYQGAGWSVGDTINVSIGQGDFLATPLQLALNIAAIANGGTVRRPLLVSETAPRSGQLERREPQVLREVEIDPRWMDTVREGMRRVVHGEKGTARNYPDGSSRWALTNPSGEPEIQIGGKTGTAEIGEADENGVYDRQHAWFTCFAPFDEPEIAVAILVEDGGEGSAYAVPVADRVVRTWFEISGRRKRGLVLRPDANPRETDRSVLAESAAFPPPGAFAASGPQVLE